MNKSNIKVNISGIFCTLLTIALIVLKLTNVIDWSWWLVLLPLYWWMPLFLVLFIILVIYHSLKL